MSDSQYSWNNGDTIVRHRNILSVFDKDTWTLIFPRPQSTTYDVPPSKRNTVHYQRAPAELSPVEFTFCVSLLLAGIFSTPEFFFLLSMKQFTYNSRSEAQISTDVININEKHFQRQLHNFGHQHCTSWSSLD